jgi:outer membrane protein assembly factor BamB
MTVGLLKTSSSPDAIVQRPHPVLHRRTSETPDFDQTRGWGKSGPAKPLWFFLVGVVFYGLGMAASVVLAEDQPQWGQRFSRNMVSAETGLPESFDPATGKNIKWVAPLGTESYSTPVVAGGRVLIGTNNERPRDPRHKGDRGVLLCLNEDDGSLCWQLVVPKFTPMLYRDWPRTGICSPATVEGNRVYIVSNRGEVMCLDLAGQANGNDGPFVDEARLMSPNPSEPLEVTQTDADIIWLFDVQGQLGVHQHDAAHGSILVYGEFLYVNTSNGLDDKHSHIPAPDAPSLIVLEKTTGRLVARDDENIGPRIFHSTWSSPALGQVNGRTLIFFCGGDGVCYAFDPVASAPAAGTVEKLRRVWRFDCDPTAPKENVHDYVRNHKQSPSNIKSTPVFHDNRLYVTYGGDIWWGKEQAWLKCFDASGAGDITETAAFWSYPLERHCCSTPSVHDGLVFVADCGGLVHCVDAETGRAYWTHEAKGEMWASTLVADGKVYIGTRRGRFWIMAASKEKKVISEVQLDSPIHATAVAANGVLYVATMENLYAVRNASE